jgi:uncharacterized caspase-like protein
VYGYLGLILAAVAGLQPTLARADQHALLVGVNRYPDFKDADLKGAGHDVRNLRQVLIREYGFPVANVRVLTDAQATLEGLRAAFRDLAGQTRAGDTVVFHFSGHGMQLPDDNGDEEDGLDEALCPCDTTPLGQNALRDDELDRLLNALPAGEVVVLLDCCHSGTATKDLNGRAVPRGLPAPGRARTGAPPPLAITAAPLGQDLRAPRRGQRRVVLSACTAAQQGYELKHSQLQPASQLDFDVTDFRTGALTFFLVQGLRGPADSNGDGRVSYAEAHAYAGRQIDAIYNQALASEAERQTPVLEVFPAELADQPVFGGAVKRPLSARLLAVEADQATLDLGAVHGLHPGQVLGLYRAPGEGRLPGPVVGQLAIDRLGLETARGRRLSGGPLEAQLVAAPLVNAAAAPDVSLLVATDPAQGANLPRAVGLLLQEVNRRLAGLAHVQREAQAGYDLCVTLAAGRGAADPVALAVQVVEANGRAHGPRRWELAAATEAGGVRAVSEEIVAWVRQLVAEVRARRSLAWLTNPAAGFGLQAVVDRRPAADANLAAYRVGDPLKFGLKATADCWYYIVAVGPDGSEQLWCPRPRAEHFAPAGRKLLHPGPGETLRLEGPPGVYVVKLLAARKPLPGHAFTNGRLRPEVFRELPPADWAESSVSLRLLPR